MLADRRQRLAQDAARAGLLADAVAPCDEEGLVALALLQRDLDARALERHPGALGDVAHELDLAVVPVARRVVLHRQCRAHRSFEDERDADEALDLRAAVARHRLRLEPGVVGDVVVADDLARAPFAVDRAADLLELELVAEDRRDAVAPFAGDGEAPPARIAFGIAGARHAEVAAEPFERGRHDRAGRGLAAHRVAPVDEEGLVALAFEQLGLGAGALQRHPGALGHVAEELDLAVAPVARRIVLHRQRRADAAVLDQRHADEGVDIGADIGGGGRILDPRIGDHVVVAHDRARHPFAFDRLADLVEREAGAGDARHAVAPFAEDREDAPARVALREGRPGDAQMPAEPFERGRHDRVGTGVAAQLVAPRDQEGLVALALLERGLGAGAGERRPGPLGQLLAQRDLVARPAARGGVEHRDHADRAAFLDDRHVDAGAHAHQVGGALDGIVGAAAERAIVLDDAALVPGIAGGERGECLVEVEAARGVLLADAVRDVEHVERARVAVHRLAIEDVRDAEMLGKDARERRQDRIGVGQVARAVVEGAQHRLALVVGMLVAEVDLDAAPAHDRAPGVADRHGFAEQRAIDAVAAAHAQRHRLVRPAVVQPLPEGERERQVVGVADLRKVAFVGAGAVEHRVPFGVAPAQPAALVADPAQAGHAFGEQAELRLALAQPARWRAGFR